MYDYVYYPATGAYYQTAHHAPSGDAIAGPIFLIVAAAVLLWFFAIYQPAQRRKTCNCDECRRKRGELLPLDTLPSEYQSPGEWPFK